MLNFLLPTFAQLTVNQDWYFDIDILHLTYKPWRLYLIICGIPSLFWALILIFVIPESPKFTFAQGDSEGTMKILRQMHRMNTGNSDDSFDVKAILKTAEFNEYFRGKSEGFFHFMWSQSVPLFKGSHLRNILTACFIQFSVCNATNSFWTFLPEILNKLSKWSHATNETATVCEVFNAVTELTNRTEVSCAQKLEVSTFVYIYGVAAVYGISYGIMSLVINKTGKLILILIIVWTSGTAALLLIFIRLPVVSSYLYLSILLAGIAISVVNASSVELFPTSMR